MLKLELSEQMVMVIANALGNHPYRESAPVIAEIQRQINGQVRQPPPINGNAEHNIGNRGP